MRVFSISALFYKNFNFSIAGYDSEGQLVDITDEQKTEAIDQIRECLFEG